jgi:hypothetical protein
VTRAELEVEIETMLRSSGLDYDDLLMTLQQLLDRFEQEAETEGQG